ncbi:MAG: glycosyltransferase family 25 protein [Parachlamydiales bacterium]|nr:glycosyltransferase family 25 protein [Parachlamydiales bacterium]
MAEINLPIKERAALPPVTEGLGSRAVKRMKILLFFCCLSLYANIDSHLKKAPNKEDNAIRNIDFIYMINLDRRPEKFALSCTQLGLYGITPYRFSAVNGWELTYNDIQDVGLRFTPDMQGGFWATTFRKKREGESSTPEMREGHCGNSYPFYGDFIWEQQILGQYGIVYFCHCMERGTIGIALSHISVLQDGWDSGFKTLWVMEDDIEVVRDPNILSELIDELDRIDPDWDILFTDRDIRDQNGNYIPATAAAKRPDFVSPNDFTQNTQVSQNLRRIGARYGAHSMIVHRRGMQKLLQFFEKHQIFLPYDMEFTLPEGIRLYTVTDDVVTNLKRGLSDNGHPRYLEAK